MKRTARSPAVFFRHLRKKKHAVGVKTVRAADLPPRSDRLDIHSAVGVVRGEGGRLVKVPDSDF